MNRVKKYSCLLLMLALFCSSIPTEAATITFRWTISISTRIRIRNGGNNGNHRNATVRLSDKTDRIEVGEEGYIALWNANNSVKWSVSKKGIIRIKKDGNGVGYIGLRPGNCFLKARYKGKTYKCKITVKKLGNNIYFSHEPYCSVETGIATIYSKYPCQISCFIENPSIASFYIGTEDISLVTDMLEHKVVVNALRPGNTRIVITNSYNQREVHFIHITVKEMTLNEHKFLNIDLKHPITMSEFD